MEQINGFPSDFLSKSEKASPEYALKWCRAAWSQKDQVNYFNGYLETARILENRNIAAGINDIDKLKSRLGAMGNQAYANLNYDVQSPLPNIVNNIVGTLINQPIRLDVQSGVSNAITEWDKEYSKRLNFYRLYKDAAAIKEQTGVDVIPKIPEKYRVDSEAEIELQMTDWRDASCVALEDAVNFVERKNDAEFVNERVARDLVENAIGAVRNSYDINGDILREYVDIMYLVTSWAERGDFKDITFAGVVKFYTPSQLIAQNKFEEKEMEEIIRNFATSQSGSINSISLKFPIQNQNGLFGATQAWKDVRIAVLELEWLTTDVVTKEEFKTSSGAYRFKDAKSNGEKRKGHIKFTTKREQQVYTASWIIDSTKVFDYGIKANQLLETPNGLNKQLGFTIYRYNMVGNKTMSVVERLKAKAEEFQIGVLKAQGVLARISPPKTVYDISSINATLAGLGKAAKSPKDIQDIAEATGTLYTTMRTQSGKAASAKPVYELSTTSDQLIATFFQFAQVKLQEMEIIIGVPLSEIGAMDKDALVGIEKLKAINRNNSLRYLNNAYKSILSRVAEKEIQMIVDSIENGGKLEDFQIAIGKLNVEPLDLKKRILLRDHNIFVKALPDAMDLEIIDQQINQSLAAGIIKPSDALYINQLKKQNLDKVRAYLAMKEDKYAKMQQEQAAAASQAQAAAQAEAQAQIEQMKAQTEQMKMQMEGQLLQLKAQLESKQSQQDFLEEIKLQQQKLQGELEKIRVATEEAAKANQLEGGNDMKNTSLPANSGVRQPKTPQGVGN